MEATIKEIDARFFRKGMSLFPTGVTVVLTQTPRGIHGITVNSFISVSLDPLLILVSIDKNTKMYKYICSSDKYSVNILSENQKDLCWHFAGKKGSNLEIFFEEKAAAPVLPQAVVRIVADVVDRHEAGDHVLVIGSVVYMDYHEEQEPLVFCRGKLGRLVLES
ncbi:MAG: flavin reductase family protein [Rhodothermus sp.]|nr:flavin reductase family protein [Rhodothermus sp.]